MQARSLRATGSHRDYLNREKDGCFRCHLAAAGKVYYIRAGVVLREKVKFRDLLKHVLLCGIGLLISET